MKIIYSLRILSDSSKEGREKYLRGDWHGEESCALEGHGQLLLGPSIPFAFISLLFMLCFGKTSEDTKTWAEFKHHQQNHHNVLN